jgi:hypothetical protein
MPADLLWTVVVLGLVSWIVLSAVYSGSAAQYRHSSKKPRNRDDLITPPRNDPSSPISRSIFYSPVHAGASTALPGMSRRYAATWHSLRLTVDEGLNSCTIRVHYFGALRPLYEVECTNLEQAKAAGITFLTSHVNGVMFRHSRERIAGGSVERGMSAVQGRISDGLKTPHYRASKRDLGVGIGQALDFVVTVCDKEKHSRSDPRAD